MRYELSGKIGGIFRHCLWRWRAHRRTAAVSCCQMAVRLGADRSRGYLCTAVKGGMCCENRDLEKSEMSVWYVSPAVWHGQRISERTRPPSIF